MPAFNHQVLIVYPDILGGLLYTLLFTAVRGTVSALVDILHEIQVHGEISHFAMLNTPDAWFTIPESSWNVIQVDTCPVKVLSAEVTQDERLDVAQGVADCTGLCHKAV